MSNDADRNNRVERAVRTYESAWNEADPVARARLLETCFAVDGRVVTGGQPMVGRAGLAARIAVLRADPRGLRARIMSPIDVQGPLFRFRAVMEAADGTVLGEAFDAGELDGDGRIATILTFVGFAVL